MLRGGIMKKTKLLSFSAFILIVLLLSPVLAKAQGAKIRVIVPDASVRLKPEAGSPEIGKMPLGSILELGEETDGWYKVTLPKDEGGYTVVGYILKSETELVSGAATKKAVPKKKAAAPAPQPTYTPPAPLTAQGGQATGARSGMWMGFRLYGGFGTLFGINHINDALGGINDYYADYEAWMVDSWMYSTQTTGTLELLKSAISGGFEFIFNINPYIGFGLGAGYITASKDAGLAGFSGTWSSLAFQEEWGLTQKVTAIPIMFNIYGGLPLGKMIHIAPYMGVGYYLGRVMLEDYYYHYAEEWWFFWPPETEYNGSWTGKANAFGFQGGLNIDINFTRNIGLFLGFGGLFATFKEIVGDLVWDVDDLVWGTDSGTETDYQLWYAEEEWFFPNSKWYPWLYLNDSDPQGTWTRNTEPGKVSISQFRFLIGLVIYFMR